MNVNILYRINNLEKSFFEISNKLLQDVKFDLPQNNSEKVVIVESMLIMITKNFRANKCIIANNTTSISYCS